jgi:hypothetical protein
VGEAAPATHLDASEEFVRVQADDEHDVFKARGVRGVDHVL